MLRVGITPRDVELLTVQQFERVVAWTEEELSRRGSSGNPA